MSSLALCEAFGWTPEHVEQELPRLWRERARVYLQAKGQRKQDK